MRASPAKVPLSNSVLEPCVIGREDMFFSRYPFSG